MLEDYCQRSQRTKTDILRELVRSLTATPESPLAEDSEATDATDEPPSPESLGLAISARNLLRAKVKQVTLSGISAEVLLSVGTSTELTSVITRASAERLQITVGKEVYAIIKSNSVMIAAIA